MTHLSKNIRYLRLQAGMSQEELASKLGKKSYTTIQKWESGVSEPSVKNVSQIAELFKVNINDLIGIDLQVLPSYPTTLRPDEASLLTDYNHLNDTGKGKAREYISDLLDNDKYTKDTELLNA